MSLTGLMPFSLCSCETHQTQTTQISGTMSYETHPIGSRLLGWQEGGKTIRNPRHRVILIDTPRHFYMPQEDTYKHSQGI